MRDDNTIILSKYFLFLVFIANMVVLAGLTLYYFFFKSIQALFRIR